MPLLDRTRPTTVIFGCGYVGSRLARALLDDGHPVRACARRIDRLQSLAARGAELVAIDATRLKQFGPALLGTSSPIVVYSIPPPPGLPGGEAVRRAAQAALGAGAQSFIYLGSTGVYGNRPSDDWIDERTPVAHDDPEMSPRLMDEAAVEAAAHAGLRTAILRLAAIYGPGRGVRERLKSGSYRLIDDGRRYTSRIHVDDIVRIVRAASQAPPGAVYLVADDHPSTQREYVEWLCARLDLPLPPSVSSLASNVPRTLLRGRRIRNDKVKRELAVTLAYPSFIEGELQIEAELGASANAEAAAAERRPAAAPRSAAIARAESPHRLAVLGFGRFGAALAGLIEEAGLPLRALDPSVEVPAALRATSLADLTRDASLVIVAVPVPAMPATFAALAPHLAPGTVVADVGSVKSGPVAAMAATFGAQQPWIATHPLFGPTSLARGERPLRVVVCPNPLHPEAVAQVRTFYEQLGCQVIEESAETHDRVMAYTHALAFFVAKGMLDAGAPIDTPYAPPSFQALARVIGAVRGDAGHLFVALHRENPFAFEARQRLLEALHGIDHELGRTVDLSVGQGPAELSPALYIPDLGTKSPELHETRELIDEIDEEIIALLARRAQLARRAAHAKTDLGHGVRDPIRESHLLETRRQKAQSLDLDPDAIEDVFRAVLRFSRRLQESQ